VPVTPAGASLPAPRAQSWRQVGITNNQSAEQVPVEDQDNYVPVELYLPDQRARGAISVKAVLDSGAHFTSMSVLIVEMLERLLPGEQIRIPFSLGARQAITASGQRINVTERTIPLQLAFLTTWGPEKLPQISFAIMPGTDGVVLLGLPMLRGLGVDPYDRLLESLKTQMPSPGWSVETPAFLATRRVSLSGSVTDAVKNGLEVSKAERLRGILYSHVNAFRRALRGDPPARVEPMRVTLKPGAAAVKAKPRRYDPVKSSWLASCMGALVAFGLVFRNLQAVWSSPAMAGPKKDSFRLVSDYGAVNHQVEKPPGVMPNQESDMIDPLSARYFVTTPFGIFTPQRVPQGVLNATCYFQGVMVDLLDGLKCKIWVDDVFFFADTEDELLDTL
ncbi:unnamed protein product, partial [Sphacelaria rigidula]